MKYLISIHFEGFLTDFLTPAIENNKGGISTVKKN